MSIEAELSKFTVELENAVHRAMEGAVADLAKATMQQAVDDIVYKGYTPSGYLRRKDDGGLRDIENMETEYDRDTMTLTLTNVTRDYHYSGTKERLVAPIVEKGVGYTWKESEIYALQPFPRPFNAYTEKMMENGLFEQALAHELGKEFKVKIV